MYFRNFFVLNRVRVSNLHRLNYTLILVEYRRGTLTCLRYASSSTTPILPSHALLQSPLPRPRHVDPPPALALLTVPLLLSYLAHLSFDLHQLIGLSGLWDLVHRASFLFFPVSGCNLIRFEYHSRSPPRCHWKNLTRNKQFLRLVRTSSWAFQRQ